MAYSSFEDYLPITKVNIGLSLLGNKTQADKITQYDLSSLANRDISNQYTVTEINKFDTPQETSERYIPQDEYENFVTTQMEAAAECIPTKPRVKYIVHWESIAVWGKWDMKKLVLFD